MFNGIWGIKFDIFSCQKYKLTYILCGSECPYGPWCNITNIVFEFTQKYYYCMTFKHWFKLIISMLSIKIFGTQNPIMALDLFSSSKIITATKRRFDADCTKRLGKPQK